MAGIGVNTDPVTGQVKATFLTCSAIIPTNPGLHVVPTSCGAGKTTIICLLAKADMDLGVLIIVATKKDADAIGGQILGLGVSPADILVLHCQNAYAMGEYKTDPHSLRRRKILVITSARIQIDPKDLFLDYAGGVRGRVFIDETINFFPEPFHIPEGLYEILTFIDEKKSHAGKAAIEKKVVDGVTYYRHLYKDKKAMEAAFALAGSYAKKLLPARNELDKVKRNVIFEHIIAHGFTPIQQNIQEIARKTNVEIFDGTGDLIFSAKDSRLVPITGMKYSSDIQFHRFPFRMKRYDLEDCQESDVLKLAGEFIDLVKVKAATEKVLVVCWKTVGVRQVKELKDRADLYEQQEDMPGGFPEILRRALISAGVNDDNVFITYRGSGQDRGSNEYRDCSAVIFLGSWRLPEEPITSKISDMFGLKMKFDDYKKALLVQTICRSRIRQHSGLPIEVYFSEDINYQMAWEVQEYFKANSPDYCKIGGLVRPCQVLSKPDKGNLYDMVRLYSHDPRIRLHVESGTAYSFTIPKSTLFKLVPKDKREVGRYKRFIKFLSALQLTMTIT